MGKDEGNMSTFTWKINGLMRLNMREKRTFFLSRLLRMNEYNIFIIVRIYIQSWYIYIVLYTKCLIIKRI